MADTSRRAAAAADRPRFRFRSEHPGLTLMGLGWLAQFEDGRFETDDRRVAEGIAMEAMRDPGLKIGYVRGSEKPAEPTVAPAAADSAPDQGGGGG